MKKMLTVTVFVLFALLAAREGTAEINYRILHQFNGENGSAPYGHLISVGDRLYGMTAGDSIINTGMVFSIAPDGSDYSILHHFQGLPDEDGQWPQGGLFFQGDTLYGITWAGGCGGGLCPNIDNTGCGTLFSLKTDGTDYNVFWKFACNGWADGSLPNAHFISDGNRLYSTAGTGGSYDDGVVFAVQPDGTGFTVLHSFDEFSKDDGNQPGAGLALEDGVLYGTTFSGGEYGEQGFGTVFSIRTDGSDFTTLHDFTGPDGKYSGSTPILADGRLYGVTIAGGAYDNGVIFSMGRDGSDYQVLHHFTADESGPMEGVILVGDRLYGATAGTGANDTYGVIYSLRTDGSDYKVLYRFDYSSGYWVDGHLLLAGDTFYGLASHGGETGHGVIFAFEPTVVIDGCDTGVSDIILPTGRSLSEEIAMCAASAGTHGEFVSCVSHLTNDLKKDGIITGKEKGKIQSCAAQANIP